MTTKNNLLSIIDKELSKLIISYEKQQQELENQVTVLTEKIKELEKENVSLVSIQTPILNADFQKKYDTLLHFIERMTKGISHALIDEWFLSPSIDNAIILLIICEKLLEDRDLEMLVYIYELLEHDPALLLFNDREVTKNFLAITENILLEEHFDNGNSIDTLIRCILNIFTQLRGSLINEDISHFVIEKHERVFDYVLILNEPAIITKYLRVLMTYNLRKELKDALIYILDVEWSFIDSSLRMNDFVFFLWYCYLFRFEEDLLNLGSINLKWFDSESDDLALYFYLLEQGNNIDKETYEKKVKQFNNGSVLTSLEKEIILQMINNEVNSKLVNNLKTSVFFDKIYVIEDDQENYFIHKYKLKRQNATLPLYKGKNENLVCRYAETLVLSDTNKQQIFITKTNMKELLKKNNNLTPKVKKHKVLVPPVDLNNQVQNSSTFSWPTTEVTNNKKDIEREGNTLNDKSALMLMGYRISGRITRVERWKILEKAVPNLGLKKVAYTIAYNVKLRKGQKNGEVKFHHAITEWEHDLMKLKKIYYKKEFNWPNT